MYHYLKKFESISEFGDFALENSAKKRVCSSDHTKSFSTNAETPHSLEQCVEIAQHGGYWEKGAENLAEVNVTGDAAPVDRRRVLRPNVVGFMPNVPALLAGQPLSMLDLPRAGEVNRLVRIGVGVTLSASTPPAQLYNRGRAVLAVVDDLVTKGYGVEVWAVVDVSNANANYDDKPTCRQTLAVQVKPSFGSWSPSSAAFMLANSSIYRRIGFDVTQRDKKLYDLIGGGMGYPESKDTIGHDVWLEGIFGQRGAAYSTADGALKVVTEKVQAYLNRDAV
jgi:hypothetical protein